MLAFIRRIHWGAFAVTLATAGASPASAAETLSMDVSTIYSATCAGKVECTPGDTLDIKGQGNTTPGALASLRLKLLPRRDCPAPDVEFEMVVGGTTFTPLSLPLAPLLARMSSSGSRAALMCSAAGKATLVLSLQPATGTPQSASVGIDLQTLWSGGVLEPQVRTADCAEPCRFDSDVSFTVMGLAAWRAAAGNDTDKLTLTLDGTKVPGLIPRYVPLANGDGKLTFQLQRFADKPESVAAWRTLQESALKPSPSTMALGLADPKGPMRTLHNVDPKLYFVVMAPERRAFWLAFALFLLATVVAAVGTSSKWALLRDRYDIPDQLIPTERRSFSLGRCQMLLWTIVVILAWLNGVIATGQWFTINETALTLMGIGAATAVGAAVATPPGVTRLITAYTLAGTGSQARADAAADIQDDPQINSQNFWKDLLSDNGLHRLQLLFFTPMVASVFLWQAFWEGAMPVLPGTTLALLGISAAGYVGFKMTP